MNPLVAIFALVAVTLLPKSAVIVDSKEDFGGAAIGNVKVTFNDGHTERWTKTGKSQMPKVAASGLVGWLKYEKRYEKMPIFDTLRIVWPDEHHADFKADEKMPFIEDWAFADNDTAVIVVSRATHGPASYIKYALATGKILDQAQDEDGKKLPAWAVPWGPLN